MSTQVNTNKIVFEKNKYQQTIDTSFTQLVPPSPVTPTPLPTIDEFFQYYQDLFFQIPKEGTTNSHQYLVEQSSNYIGADSQLAEITALQEEITALRQENLSLNQQLIQQTTSSL